MELCLKLFLLPASHGRVPNLVRSPALDLVLAQGQPRRLDPDLVLDQSRRVRAENRWRKSPRRLRRLRRRKRLRKWSESARPRPKGASQRGDTTKEPKRRPRFAGGDDPPASELTDSITKLRCLFVSLLKTLKDFVSTISWQQTPKRWRTVSKRSWQDPRFYHHNFFLFEKDCTHKKTLIKQWRRRLVWCVIFYKYGGKKKRWVYK